MVDKKWPPHKSRGYPSMGPQGLTGSHLLQSHFALRKEKASLSFKIYAFHAFLNINCHHVHFPMKKVFVRYGTQRFTKGIFRFRSVLFFWDVDGTL